MDWISYILYVIGGEILNKIIDRWNMFSRNGKIILVSVLIILIAGGFLIQASRINIVDKQYTMNVVGVPGERDVEFKFMKHGKGIGTAVGIKNSHAFTYKFDQKSITLSDKDGDSARLTHLKKGKNGILTAQYTFDNNSVQVQLTPKK